MTEDFTLRVRPLQLNPSFSAWDTNVDGEAPWPFRDRRHRFTAPDGPDAHDHPFDIEVYIPRCGGGYVEEIFTKSPNGRWWSRRVVRLPGTSFVVPAARVHRIAELLAPEVWTYVITGPSVQDWRVYPRDEIRNRL